MPGSRRGGKRTNPAPVHYHGAVGPAESSQGDDFTGTSRLRVVRRLGAGGMGVVYEAWDAEQGARVAIKRLRSMSAERLLMFKNEFRALQDLSHPNLVALHELFEHDGEWFFTMELVDGVPLLQYLRGPDAEEVSSTRTVTHPESDSLVETAPADAWGPVASHPMAPILDETRLGPVLAQVARGLGALHRRGKVHRDIKPSNVLVTGDGRVVILDFGLIAPAGDAAPALRPSLVGTPGYMAPEQAGGAWVGPPADWYAVGVILYQVLCGRLPFLGSPEDVMRAKLRVAPIPPRMVNPAASPRLEALCLALLRASPERRAGAADVLSALGEPAGTNDAALPGTVGFVGRTRELAALDRALADAGHGPVSVLIRGESGIGKSALCAEWAGRLAEREPEALVLAGRCYERESVPYKALDGVVDALAVHLAHAGDGAIGRQPEADRAVLARAFPALEPPPAPGGDGDAPADVTSSAPSDGGGAGAPAAEPAHERRLLYAAMRALLADVARRRRLIVQVDDLQWADEDGLALLREALAPPDAPPVLIVATERADAPSGAGRLPGEVRVVELAGLAPDDAAVLAARWAAGRSDAAAIAAEARGHPLFIAELAQSPAGAPRGGARLEDALWRRIAPLEGEPRGLLDVVAIAGQPVRQDLAAACARLEPARMVAVLAALREARLVRTTGPSPTDSVDVFHARVRDAVLGHLEDAGRRAGHRALAEALESAAHGDAEAIAEHWLGAGEPARALDFWIDAAEEAAQALAFDRAARLYRRALDVTDDPARAQAARLALGQALADGGRGADAARVLQEAAADAEPAAALDLRRRAAEQLLRAGHVDEGLASLRDVLAAVGLRLPADGRAALPRLLALRARVRLRGYRLARPRAIAPARDARIRACWSAAVGLSMVDAVRGAEFQTRMLLTALGAGDGYHAALAMALEAGHLSAGGASGAARTARVVERARALAAGTGDPHAMAMATGAAGVAAYLEGRFADALELATQGERLMRAQCVGATWERDTVTIVGAWSRGYMGHLAELARRIPDLVAEAADLGDLYLATSLQTGTLVGLPLTRGEPARARRAATEAMQRWTHQGFLHQHWDDLLGQGEIDLYEGDAAGAAARVEAGWPALRRALVLMIQMSRCEAWSLRARAALARLPAARATERSRVRELEAGVAAGIRALRRQAAWCEPVAAMLAAGRAAAAGEAERAARALRLAIAGFDGVHMALHAAVARRRLAAVVGGSEGDELRRLARDYERREGVVEPARVAAWLAPGFSRIVVASAHRLQDLLDLGAPRQPEPGEHDQRLAQHVLAVADPAALDQVAAIGLERLGQLGVVADLAEQLDRAGVVRLGRRQAGAGADLGLVGVVQAGRHDLDPS